MTFDNFKATYLKEAVEEFPNRVPASPLVSVCVPTYQHVNFIKQCLDGMISQSTNFAFEIIVGEDGSSDGTRDTCIDYAKRFPEKIRLLLHNRTNNIHINGKPSGRFNFLYNMYSARGKYIALCEGDDFWTDNSKLQKQFDFLERNPDFAVSFHNIRFLNDAGAQKVSREMDGHATDNFELRDLATGVISVSTPSLVFRNLISDGVLATIVDKPIGDFPLLIQLAKKGKLHFHKDVMAVYRTHSGGIWSGKSLVQRNLTTINTIKAIQKESSTELCRQFDIYLMKLYKTALYNSLEDSEGFVQVFAEFHDYDAVGLASFTQRKMRNLSNELNAIKLLRANSGMSKLKQFMRRFRNKF